VRAHACCPVYRSHSISPYTTLLFRIRYHVVHISYTGHVLQVGNLPMTCIRILVVQYVGHTPLPRYNIVYHASVPCPVCMLHTSSTVSRQLTYVVHAHACCAVCWSHSTSTNIKLYFTRHYHVQYVVYTGPVLHIGSLHILCVRRARACVLYSMLVT